MMLAGCNQGPEHHTFVERLGTDTLSVESFTRTPEAVEGSLVLRSPQTQMAHYRADLKPDGGIGRLEVEWTTPAENPDGPGPRRMVVEMEGDSATVTTEGGRNPGTQRVATPDNTFPVVGVFPMAYGIMDEIARNAVESGQDEFTFHTLAGSGRVGSNALVRHGADSVSLDFFGSPIYASIQGDGELTGRSGAATTMKVEGTEVDEPVDIGALAADFAARDAAGRGMGVASPTTTLEGGTDDLHVAIRYSRPAKRGRAIWGGLVPFNEVWRTGANAATIFTTDRDLIMGGTRIPAGSYSLWTTFTPDEATLIVNSETGQWGTAYNAEHDFARLPLEKETLPEPVERFTFAVDPTDDGIVLGLSWDRTRFSIAARTAGRGN